MRGVSLWGGLARRWRREWLPLAAGWNVMGFYQRFEQAVALLLTFIIAIVVLMALYDLAREVVRLLVARVHPPAERVFQTLFGQIMTLLIALEFKHSILRLAARRDNIVRVRTVLLIAILALSRKFIVLDANASPPGTIFALAAVILALGVTYWLVRERDEAAGEPAAGWISPIERAMEAARRRVGRLERLERLREARRVAAGNATGKE
jgi:uncharacterized membrane protein (DUF373 family)